MRAVLAAHDSTSLPRELHARALECVASKDRVDRVAILPSFTHQSDYHVLGKPLPPYAPELARISRIGPAFALSQQVVGLFPYVFDESCRENFGAQLVELANQTVDVLYPVRKSSKALEVRRNQSNRSPSSVSVERVRFT